jgi:hypothetical protein
VFACRDGRDHGSGAVEGKLLPQFCGIVAKHRRSGSRTAAGHRQVDRRR